MQTLKTENCVVCGSKAKYWHGHVKGLYKYALGYSERKVIAGFCENHKEHEESDENGCYGEYDSRKMGKCVPLFNRQ